jgi:hypothetical protein
VNSPVIIGSSGISEIKAPIDVAMPSMSFMDDASFVVPVTPISQYLNPQGFVLASRYSQYNIDSFHIQYHPGNSITSSGMAGGVLT